MLCLGPSLPDLGHPSGGTWASGSPSDPTRGAQAGVLGVGHDLPSAPLSPMVRSRAVPGAHLTGGKTEAWACGRAEALSPALIPGTWRRGQAGRQSTGVRSLGVTLPCLPPGHLLRCPQPVVCALQPSPHPAHPASLGLTATPAGPGDIYLGAWELPTSEDRREALPPCERAGRGAPGLPGAGGASGQRPQGRGAQAHLPAPLGDTGRGRGR